VNEMPPPQALLQLTSGYWISQSIYVAAKLGIADLLRDGPQTCEELASATGTDGPSLYRVMRALASVGVFAERDGGRLALTPTAELLRSGEPGSMRALAIMLGEESYRAWGELMHSVKTGEPAFDHVFGMRRWEYLARHPEAADVFNEAMTGLFGRVHAAVAKTYDFSRFTRVVDVGGGNGLLLTLILRANPRTSGVLFEAPAVIPDAKRYLEAAGVAHRCPTLAGDFFESVPEGGDAYLLAHVMQSFDDDRCVKILANCRRAIVGNGALLLVEPVIAPGNDPSPAKLLDLHMLVVTGGRQRSAAEYSTLLASAGFRLARVIPTDSGESVVEGVCA
jgi:O-methyltransferase domain/Dimerisation domain